MIFLIYPVLYLMCFSTWLGFCDFEFFLCCWVAPIEPGVEAATWLVTELSAPPPAALLIADCWLALCCLLTCWPPALRAPAVPVVLCAR